LVELGVRAAGRKDVAEAREVLAAAGALARETGNAIWCTRVDAALRRVGAPGKSASLTPQEAKIATMARAGYSNKEIARKLVLTTRTVEYHLSAVYRKLGIAGRRDLHLAPVTLH
jgi:DNA-binding NarL/FixJ family response regulator